MQGSEKRQIKAEKDNKLSISHWKGDLHTHTKSDVTPFTSPEKIVETRKGSNCGDIPLQVLAKYHALEMRNEYIAITDHSRDGDPQKALAGITKWFEDMYLKNEDWLEKAFGKKKGELTEDEKIIIQKKAAAEAEKLALYGDERIEEVLREIDQLREGDIPITVLKGIEANLLPDGSFDTPMVKQGKFELVNCSIHPNVDGEGFQSVITDPKKYSELAIKGIENPKVNIMCHLGFDCPPEMMESLDWPAIAEAAIKNDVAIEINLKDLMDSIYKEFLNYDKYPKNDTSYIAEFKEKLDQLVPILSSEKIRKALKPFFQEGLKISINTDAHKIKFVESKVTEEGITENFKERDFRFWRCLKILEKYFNDIFSELDITRGNIINTYSRDDLEKFISKEQ